MRNLRRNNHYVPSCYQRGFADPLGKVWVKFASQESPVYRNPLTVARLRNFYIRRQRGVETDNVEHFFEAIETPFGAFSRRTKDERNELVRVSQKELSGLAMFVACLAVRTLAHKHCVEEQAGSTVASGTFVTVMIKMIWTIMDHWRRNPPQFDFYTPLPYIGEQFITGDHPVVVVNLIDNPIWVPTDTPKRVITRVGDLLLNPKHGLQVSLSPYIMVSLQGHTSGQPGLPPRTIEPREVRFFNDRVRGQSSIFTLARDKESLART